MANPNGIYQGTNELGGQGEILPAAGITARQPLSAAQASQRLGIWGSALNGVFGLLANGLNYYNAAQQREFEKQENELAYQRSLENRAHMESYNDPAAQVARYLNAGINPASVFGNVSGGTTQDAQYNSTAGQRTDFDPTAFIAMAQQITQLKQMSLQAKLLEQEYRLNNDDNSRKNALNDAQIKWLDTQGQSKGFDLSRAQWLFNNYEFPYYSSQGAASETSQVFNQWLSDAPDWVKGVIGFFERFAPGLFHAGIETQKAFSSNKKSN